MRLRQWRTHDDYILLIIQCAHAVVIIILFILRRIGRYVIINK